MGDSLRWRMRDFRHIRAWQRAHALSIALHRLARDFGRKGHGKLRAQLTSSVHSIATNIVEGCGASTHKEFARYLDIWIKSANETEYHLLTSRDLRLISAATWQRFSTETIEVRRMIFGYQGAILRDESGPAHRDDQRPPGSSADDLGHG
jgi:four helix bundle protein